MVKSLRKGPVINTEGLGPGDEILNLSGKELEAIFLGKELEAVEVTSFPLSDTWHELDGGAQWTVAQLKAIVSYLEGLGGTTNLRVVCNAGRNRSPFAACLYCIMFGLPPPKNGPDTNKDFKELLDVARKAREDGTTSAHGIGSVVIKAAEAMLLDVARNAREGGTTSAHDIGSVVIDAAEAMLP